MRSTSFDTLDMELRAGEKRSSFAVMSRNAECSIGPDPVSSATMQARASPAGRMRFAYPLMLDVTDRPVVIVGGGAVAVRKARGLLNAGATRVTIVASEFHADLPSGVHRMAERYEPRHLEGAELVFAAT